MDRNQESQIRKCMALAGNGKHKYQIFFTALICVLTSLHNLLLIGQTLTFITPMFECSGSEGLVAQSEACQKIDSCRMAYDFTLTGEATLYCQKQWIRNTVQVSYFFGCVIALISSNLISDIVGRKFSLLVSLSVCLLGQACLFYGGLQHSTFFMIVGQFLSGGGVFAADMVSLSYLTDITNDHMRQISYIVSCTSYSVAAIVIGVAFIFQINWKHLYGLLIILPTMLLFFLIFKFMEQSPFVLINKNQKDEALKSLIAICKFNDRNQFIPEICQIIQDEPILSKEQQISLGSIICALIKFQNYSKILLLTVILFTYNCNYFIEQITFAEYGFGFGVNSIIGGVADISVYVFMFFYLEKLLRRQAMAISNSIAMWIGIFFFFDWFLQSNILTAVFSGFLRTFILVTYVVLCCAQFQHFPLQIQSTAVGVIQCVGLFGFMVSPTIFTVSTRVNLNPIGVASLLYIFTIAACYLLNETRPEQEKIEGDKQSSQSQI